MTKMPSPAEELRILDHELVRLDARRAQLLARRAWLLSVLSAAPVLPPPPAAGARAATQAPGTADTAGAEDVAGRASAPEASGRNRARSTGGQVTGSRQGPAGDATPPGVRNVLLVLGGLLLSVAAVAFTVVSWGHLGIAGRSAVLGAVTLTALGATAPLLHRRLTATAEAVAGVGLALTVLDAYALHRVALPGTDATAYAAVATAVLAVGWAAYGLRLGALRMPLPAAVLCAQLPLLLWAIAAGAGPQLLTVALLLPAAADAVLALRAPGRAARTVAVVCACGTGAWGLLAAAWLSWTAQTPLAAVQAGGLLLLAALPALGAAWRLPQFAAPSPAPRPVPLPDSAWPGAAAATTAPAPDPRSATTPAATPAAVSVPIPVRVSVPAVPPIPGPAVDQAGALTAGLVPAVPATGFAASGGAATALALIGGLTTTAAVGGLLRTALPGAWAVPGYLLCGVALFAAACTGLARTDRTAAPRDPARSDAVRSDAVRSDPDRSDPDRSDAVRPHARRQRTGLPDVSPSGGSPAAPARGPAAPPRTDPADGARPHTGHPDADRSHTGPPGASSADADPSDTNSTDADPSDPGRRPASPPRTDPPAPDRPRTGRPDADRARAGRPGADRPPSGLSSADRSRTGGFPRAVGRGLAGAGVGVQVLAVLWALPVAAVAVSGPLSRIGQVWAGAPADARAAVRLDLFPGQHPAVAAVVFAVVACVLAAAAGSSARTAVPAARRPIAVTGALLAGCAALSVVPLALRLPYTGSLAMALLLTAVTLALAVRAAPTTGQGAGPSAETHAPVSAAGDAAARRSLVAAALALPVPAGTALTATVLALVFAVSAGCLSLATQTATLVTMSLLTALFAAAAALVRAGSPPYPGRASAGAASACAAALACAAGAAAGLGTHQLALPVLAVTACAVLLAARLGGEHPLTPTVEAGAIGTGMLAVALAAGDRPLLALVLALCAVFAAGSALRKDRLVVAGHAATVLFVLATWVRLTAWDVQVPEAYTLPATLPALLIGAARRQRLPATSSWAAYGPGLAATLVPSLIAAWGDRGWERPLLLGAAALLVTLAGARHRLQGPLVLGSAVLALDALHELAPVVVQVVGALPRWLPPALAGLVLLVLGATYEQRLRDARRVRETLGRMR